MKQEKEYTEGISIKENKFLSWLDNFWYHYKWHTIVTVFIVTVISICTFQMCTKPEYDIIFTYAGPKEFLTDPQEQINITSSLSNAATVQYGEGAAANLHTYIIYSKEQINKFEEEQRYDISAQMTKNLQELETFSQTGYSYIFLLDPYVYDHLKNKSEITDRFVKLSDLFGETPSNAYDEYAVKLVDTDFYKNNPALHVLPEDTVICLHARLWLSTKESIYNEYFEFFKKFVVISETTEESNTND